MLHKDKLSPSQLSSLCSRNRTPFLTEALDCIVPKLDFEFLDHRYRSLKLVQSLGVLCIISPEVVLCLRLSTQCFYGPPNRKSF